MIFKRTIIFFAVVFGVAISMSAAPLVFNSVSLTPKTSYKQPIVLNSVAPKAWFNDDQRFESISPLERVGIFTLGLGELAVGFSGLFFVTIASVLMSGGGQLKLEDHLWLAAYQYSGCFFAGRVIYEGAAHVYNGIAQDYKQITINTKARLALGIGELCSAAIMGLFMLSYSKLNGGLSLDGVILTPGLWGLALVGAYDVIRAKQDMNRGITIARF